MGRRNPIHVVGDPIRKGVTWLSDELIREGAHQNALGSDGFVVMAYMLSCASSPEAKRRAWETSPLALSKKFGWGENRVRAMRAIEGAEKDNRLVRRKYLLRDGKERENKCVYVVCAGGRRFTDEELSLWSRPIEC